MQGQLYGHGQPCLSGWDPHKCAESIETTSCRMLAQQLQPDRSQVRSPTQKAGVYNQLPLHCYVGCGLVPVQTVHATGLVDARVGAAPVTAPEAATVAKPNGMRKASEPSKDTHIHRHIKRSYKRAYARSCREGGARYKGQWRPMEWFAKTPLRTPKLRSPVVTQTHTPHWTIISWNAAGLTAETFQELETYARTARADIFMLQETKWNFGVHLGFAGISLCAHGRHRQTRSTSGSSYHGLYEAC